MAGTAILLNGTGSAGKTTVIKELQELFDEPYLHVGIDMLMGIMCPEKYCAATPQARESFFFVLPEQGMHEGFAMIPGLRGDRMVMALHQTIASLLIEGHHVAVDHWLVYPHWLHHCVETLHPLPVLFVGVRCPLAVAERRSDARPERPPGDVRWAFDRVHAHSIYDLEVDSSLLSAHEIAVQIQQRLQHGPRPTALKELWRRFTP
jgi:chloramphenicol 3-O phosphotransferase